MSKFKMKPKFLKGKLKQSEGSSPREAMPSAKKAGKFGVVKAKIQEKKRGRLEKRLEKEAM